MSGGGDAASRPATVSASAAGGVERNGPQTDANRSGPRSAAAATESDGVLRTGGVAAVDRALYALFARHAGDRRHAADRKRYRGTALTTGFETYLAWTYGISWLVAVGVVIPVCLVAISGVPSTAAAVDAWLADLSLAGYQRAFFERFVSAASASPVWIAVVVAGLAGACAKRATVELSGAYLRWLTAARRTDIERTLPSTVRYLELLASGSDSPRAMVAKTTATDTYGGTGTSLRKALNAARLTGSLDEGLRRVARDTPSRELLAPFLLKFRKHAAMGDEALATYLRTESRMLAHRQDRARKRARRFLELLTELFVAVLVLPALLVIGATALTVVIPEFLSPVATPVGVVPTRAVVLYGSVLFLVAIGVAGAVAVGTLRPPNQRARYDAPGSVRGVAASVGSNPASAALIAAPPAVVLAIGLAIAGYTLVNVVLLAYAAFAIPVGAVAARRTRIDDAKDRELADFVHAVSGHVAHDRPFPDAVAAVTRDVDLGVLNEHVADLAFALRSTTATGDPQSPTDVRAAAIDRFVERVGTPLAAGTLGLVPGALDAGSDADAVFETLRIEVGQLYSEQRALRSSMHPYVAVGWAAAVLVAGVVAVVNTQVIDAARLAELGAATDLVADPETVHPELERFRLYVVTQATMLASGWFAGTAARGWYAALLHSGVLVLLCYVVFALGGLL